MSNSDGSWERVVADVVIAGQPRVVYNLAQHTKGMADAIPEHAQRLAILVNHLCDRKDGWHGRAAKEFQDVVAGLAHEIGALSDDLTVIAGQLDGAAAKLSEAIAHIPVPLTKTTSWGWDVDHELPNHTPMDDSLHDPDTFKNALVSDYAKNPSNYRDFLKLVTDPVTGRTATSHDANYQGVPDAQLPKNSPNYDLRSHQAAERANRLAHWYSHNASIALHWQTELADYYHDCRRDIPIDYGSDLRDPDGTVDKRASAPQPRNELSIPGSYDTNPSHYVTSQDNGSLRTSHSKNAIEGGLYSSDRPKSYADVQDTGLASVSSNSPLGQSNVRPQVYGRPESPSYGMLSPGSASSGPDQYPTSPLTSAHQALSSGGETNTSQIKSSSPMGLMPTSGSQVQKRDERRTWLTEDEDYWSSPLGPPAVIE